MKFWSVFLLSFIATAILTPGTIFLAPRIGALDIPKDNRRVHTRPIPRIGGIAIFIGVSLSILLLLGNSPKTVGIVAGGAVIFLAGFIDDLKGLPPAAKLVGQFLGAVIVFSAGVRIEFVRVFFISDMQHFGMAISFVLTIIWIVAITNTINLIDGLDGLAAGVTAIASCCIGYAGYIHGTYILCLPMLALAGGALGFLPYNFYPAKTFMGDCGSQYLGFMMASCSILGVVKSTTLIAMVVPVVVLGLPIFDTVFAIFRRAINHKPIMQADKGHIHHHMLKTGMGQRRTVLCMYGVCAIMGTAAVLFSRNLLVEALGLSVIACMYIYIVLTDSNRIRPTIKKKAESEESGNDPSKE